MQSLWNVINLFPSKAVENMTRDYSHYPFAAEAQTALFKDPVRTAA